ncbi:hypothetical protein PMI30_06071 [Pseudomonas sp. GM50]|uniref:hypothetical protein n=1 Tax=Pseudomonas sp. GM50 TaxID=1144332 RepID=UPI000270C818|nr:hypothetical protein [Pseudomonas sp. GM50]EJM58616.1 hypothetical protein PMI30_06071 [Pseudomonas sp. GM50]
MGENQGEYLQAAIDQVMVSGDDNEAPARPETRPLTKKNRPLSTFCRYARHKRGESEWVPTLTKCWPFSNPSETHQAGQAVLTLPRATPSVPNTTLNKNNIEVRSTSFLVFARPPG